MNIHWKEWCWSWNFNTLTAWYEELTHLKRPWCWERWKAGGEGDDRGWDGWMASPTQWTWVWVNSGSWRWTGKPGVLQSMGSQRVRHDWATELNWHKSHSKLIYFISSSKFSSFLSPIASTLFCLYFFLPQSCFKHLHQELCKGQETEVNMSHFTLSSSFCLGRKWDLLIKKIWSIRIYSVV